MTISRNLSILAEGVSSSGVLAATNGGTGVTTSTGSGSNVLSASPTFSGTITFPGSTAIDSSGNVGIGTSVTYNKLNVLGGIATYYDTTNYPAVRGYISHTGNTGGFQINAQGANNSTNGAGNITFWTPSANSANGSTDATLTEKMRINSSGNVGIGTSSPSAALSVAGAITATGSITAYYSDDRLKTRKGNIQNALAKVETLNGFNYEANEVAQALGYEAKPEVGISAQEVQAVMPEVVVPAPIDEKYLTVHYDRMVPLLVEAIKELSAKVKELESKQCL